ncbi:MAG: serine/threonine protein kinase [Acidobacteria bacterium]|nr:serine/threonine protein kinase [Acidobacteriota bacterium]
MDGVPKQVGVYTLEREISQGGMGVVYLASRTSDFSKQVALKVLKRGMDTDALLRRFRREREILARLEHPNIARLLDGGALPDGRPYLVMEYVDGVPVTEHCRPLHIGKRLRLFLQICEGVICAHRSLVIHRDLKPANILVTEAGEVKLLDFGIAKLLEADHEETLAMTTEEHTFYTPEYASPEQLERQPVTVATDVYSLGAVLREMLREPGTELPQDLTAIIAMATREEPERRYASVEQFAADVRRFLDGVPVAAHAGSTSYRARKFLARHKGSLSAAVLAIAGVVGGIGMAVHETGVAQRNADTAERRFAQVRKLASVMLFDQYDSIKSVPGATKAREAIVRTAQEYLDSLAAEAGNNRELAMELAGAYHRLGDVQGMPGSANLGRVTDAIASYAKARTLLDKLPPADPQVLRLAILNLRVSALLEREGRLEEGRAMRHKRLELAQRLYDMGRDKLDAWYGLIYALQSAAVADADTGSPSKALPNLQRALQLAREWDASQPSARTQSVLAQVYADLSQVMRGIGDAREAVAYDEKVLEIRMRNVTRHPNHEPYWRQAFLVHWYLGTDHAHPQLISLGDTAKGDRHCREAIRWARKSFDADPANVQAKIDLALAHRCLGAVYLMSQPALAVEEYRRSLALTEAVYAKQPNLLRHLDDAANSWWGLASALRRIGRHDEAQAPYQTTLRMFEETLAKSRNFSYRQQMMYARLEYGEMRKDSAAVRRALEMARETAGAFPGAQAELDLKRAMAVAKKVGE